MARPGGTVRIDSFNHPLDDEQLSDFIFDFGWPFVAEIARHDFLNYSKIGESVQATFIADDKSGDSEALRIRLQAENTDKDKTLKRGMAVVRAAIQIETGQPDLTDVLYSQYSERVLSSPPLAEDDYLPRDGVQAWRVQEFAFHSLYKTRSQKYTTWDAHFGLRYELQPVNRPGEVLHDDSAFFGTTDAADIPRDVEKLNEKIHRKGITKEDLLVIERSIARVGFRDLFNEAA